MQRDAPHGRVQIIADRKCHKHLTPHQKTNERSQCVTMRATSSSSTRRSQVEGKTIEALTWLMEVERRMRFLVIENNMTRNGEMLSQRLRSWSILDATPYLHAGYRCCAECAFVHLSISFPNWRHGEACAIDKNLYPVWGDDTIWKMLGQLCSMPSQLNSSAFTIMGE